MTEDREVAVYPMAAIDDIMLNTPDAMLNGQALEKVVCSCVPGIKQIKRLMLPDLEAVFVGIKAATGGGRSDFERKCPACQHENTFELNCTALLDSTTFVDEADLTLTFDNKLVVHVRPYDFEMRQIFIKREFEEDKLMRTMQMQNSDMGDLERAALLAESVDRLSQITFSLVSRSIEKITMVEDKIEITDRDHINEWLMEISKQQADMVMEAVNKLNGLGVPKMLLVQCTNCGHEWNDPISFDPTSFFGKRS